MPFLPSFFQKRLLKYALSRLEFVDTDALDPDSLGITWGQRSTFELRDVGLRLEKLSSILNLPPTCDLTKARICSLRATIPADIHSSAIVVDIEGININLRLHSGPDHSRQNEGGGSSRGPRADASPRSQSAVHDLGGEQAHNILPSTTDLAQSFLQTEPKEEKDQLREALSSQSQSLEQSLAYGYDDDDTELGIGTEDGGFLPSFLAGFLKGIGDRLQINIKDVALRVDMEVQDGVSKSQHVGRLDPICGILKIQDLSIAGVTGSSLGDDQEPRMGSRLITLSEMKALLVADTAVFSNYSRFNVPPSPTTTHSKMSQAPSSSPPPPPPLSSSPESSLAMTHSTILDRIEPESTARDNPESSTFSLGGRFSDAGSELEYGDHSYLSNEGGMSIRRDNDNFVNTRAFRGPLTASQLAEDVEDLSRSRLDQADALSEGGGHTPRQQSPHSHVSPDGRITVPAEEVTEPLLVFSTESIKDSQSSTRDHSPKIDPRFETPRDEELPHILDNTSSSGSDDSNAREPLERPTHEDLTESRIFSHEEAESMYMSAISHASSSKSFVADMPGAWGSPTLAPHPGPSGHHDVVARRLDGGYTDNAAGEDEANVSTPKLMPQSESSMAGAANVGGSAYAQGIQQSPTRSQSEAEDRTSPLLDTDDFTKIAKEIAHIERISIWIPQSTQSEQNPTVPATENRARYAREMHESSASLSDSTAYEEGANEPRFPFAHNTHPDPRHPSSPWHGEVRSRQSLDAEGKRLSSEDLDPRLLEIEISSIYLRVDIACGWLLAKMGQRMAAAWTATGAEQDEHQAEPSQSSVPLRLKLNTCSIKLLEHLPGKLISSQTHTYALPLEAFSSEDIILQANVSGLLFQSSYHGTVSKHQVEISKLTFGYASEHIISFDSSLRMRESVRDILSPVDGDILLSVTNSSTSSRVNLTTLPVQVTLNIPRLEETLLFFGGLSSILELGSSIASMSTVRGAKPEVKPNPKPRGVHFQTTPVELPTPPQVPAHAWKVNARLGGVALDFVGESCSIKLRTTALKLVSRYEGIGLQIDKAHLSGPYKSWDDGEAPANLNFGVIRVEYLPVPKENDLDRLLGLLTPSKDKYDEDDDIMLDTLFRQRRQGGVLRVTVTNVDVAVEHLQGLQPLAKLSGELSKLSTVAKYLPEDDRPGILTLGLVRELNVQVDLAGSIGVLTAVSHGLEAAHVSIPSLMAAQMMTLSIHRNGTEELVGDATPVADESTPSRDMLPNIMARFIADEMEPTVKLKLHNIRVEYSVPSIIAFLGLNDDMTAEDVAANMAHSVVNLADVQRSPAHSDQSQSYASSDVSAALPVPFKAAVSFRDCVVGLNPRDIPSRALVILTYSRFSGTLAREEPLEATVEIKKASMMIIDDVQNIGAPGSSRKRRTSNAQSDQVDAFCDLGYVPVCYVSSAMAVVKVMQLEDNGDKSLDVELRDDLLILETCADSTQTLMNTLNALKPPTPPNKALKYRTEVIPIEDMLASFSGNAFETEQLTDSEFISRPEDEPADDGEDLEYVSDFYPSRPEEGGSELSASMMGSQHLLDSFHSHHEVASSVSGLDFQEDHFAKKSAVGGTAHRWDSAHNTYGLANEVKLHGSPLRVRVRDVHFIWNLFDGYDWQRTRDTISKAVIDVETRATEKRARNRGRLSPGLDDEEESVIGDFLFNSIYIGIPANKDPRDLSHDINRNIDDLVSETGSYTTSSTATGATARPSASPMVKGKKLRLSRSKHHKMTFELRGISADLVVFPPGSGETQSSVDVRVRDLEIFDHVPTSTWKKFATYMHDVGERESGTSMIHLEILNVKPIPELAASEIVLKATLLPLRLHVDQDALDFMSRFFEFKDDSAPAQTSPGDIPFLQRVEINAIPIKLDFKPKRVDYGGLRSGRTTEFMNFFVLDEAAMVLRHVIIYGVSGFDKLGQTLNDIWMPDVKANQLPGVLAGLAPIRSLVNVGSGVKDLVVVPMREYKKDGRVVRSIQKGALAFAKTTTNELVKLGAKLAIGTQTVLQGAEDFLNHPGGQPYHPSAPGSPGWDDDYIDEDERKKISHYADQPVGVVQGLRGAYATLERDLLMARDAIVAVPGEVVESGSASGAARAVLRRAPTVILRPAIGASKAVGQTLLGAGNTLDPSNRRRVEDKYKRH